MLALFENAVKDKKGFFDRLFHRKCSRCIFSFIRGNHKKGKIRLCVFLNYGKIASDSRKRKVLGKIRIRQKNRKEVT
jgi:hypothetical protein